MFRVVSAIAELGLWFHCSHGHVKDVSCALIGLVLRRDYRGVCRYESNPCRAESSGNLPSPWEERKPPFDRQLAACCDPGGGNAQYLNDFEAGRTGHDLAD